MDWAYSIKNIAVRPQFITQGGCPDDPELNDAGTLSSEARK
jgi:hypothetical protein